MSCSGSIIRKGKYVCKHGFPWNGLCESNIELKTFVPVCMSEQVCGRLYPITGKPEQPKWARKLCK